MLILFSFFISLIDDDEDDDIDGDNVNVDDNDDKDVENDLLIFNDFDNFFEIKFVSEAGNELMLVIDVEQDDCEMFDNSERLAHEEYELKLASVSSTRNDSDSEVVVDDEVDCDNGDAKGDDDIGEEVIGEGKELEEEDDDG